MLSDSCPVWPRILSTEAKEVKWSGGAGVGEDGVYDWNEPGNWTLIVTDVATGVSAKKTIVVKQ